MPKRAKEMDFDMKIKTPVHYAAKLAVDVVFYAGIAAMFFIPAAAKFIRVTMGYAPSAVVPIAATLTLSGTCAIYILLNLKLMFRSLLDGDPFTEENVNHFRKMAAASFLIALIYTIKCVWFPSLMTGVLIFTFLIASLFCLTLKDLFKQAVAYKEENDLTV